jgi:hypothetical protein
MGEKLRVAARFLQDIGKDQEPNESQAPARQPAFGVRCQGKVNRGAGPASGVQGHGPERVAEDAAEQPGLGFGVECARRQRPAVIGGVGVGCEGTGSASPAATK